MAVTDLYEYVTGRFRRNLENGLPSWASPWSGTSAGGLPLRVNGQPFRGVNVPILWDAARKKGFSAPLWLTSRETAILGGRARKGAHPTTLLIVDKVSHGAEPGGGARTLAFLRAFTVLNLDQVRGLDRLAALCQPDAGQSPAALRERAETFLTNAEDALLRGVESATDAGATPEACAPSTDANSLAHRARLVVARAARQGALARAFSRAASGLGADLKRELALSLATEFVCADLNIASAPLPQSRFTAQAWRMLLEENRRAVFESASYAQKSLDFLRTLTPP